MKKLNKLNIYQLTHLEVGQLLQRNIDDLTTADIDVTTDAHIKAYVQQLTADKASLDQAIIQIRKQKETEDLAQIDQVRDKAFATLKRKVLLYEYSDEAAEKEAYRAINTLLSMYKGLPKLNYEAESNAITKLVQDLSSERFTTHVNAIDLQAFITKLTTANANFNTLFSQRSTDMASTVVYDTKAIRATLIEHYKGYTNYVLAMSNTVNTPYYNGILDIVNHIRAYFSDIVTRRASQGNTTPDVTEPPKA